MARRLFRPEPIITHRGRPLKREEPRQPPPEPSRKPTEAQRKKGDPKIRAKAEKLHESGMPFQMAMAVAYGKLDLNEALERMARADRVDQLMKRHQLSRALATQVVLGQAALDRVLYRRRMDEHREKNRDRSALFEAQASGAPVALGVHGQSTVVGKVTEVSAYLVSVEGHEPVHKLQIKYACAAGVAARVQGSFQWDPELRAAPREPITRPQDRYACSDKRLFRYVDRELQLELVLLEGERIQCVPRWFSRYELGCTVQIDAKGTTAELVVFRHALHDIREP